MSPAVSAPSAVAFLRRQRHSGSANPESPIPNPMHRGRSNSEATAEHAESAELIGFHESCESAFSAVAFLRRQRHGGSANPESPIPNPNPESRIPRMGAEAIRERRRSI